MKVSIKNLKGELFDIEVEGTDPISEVKIKIQTVRDDLPAPRQKLIHSGKILKDEQTIAELGISDTDFIVCMITKEIAKKPTPAAPAPVAVAASSSAPATTTAAAAPVSASINPSQESVDSLVGMGFPANESRAALIAAMGNPDLAYEFLLTGIPAHTQQPTSSPVAAAASSTPAAASSGRVTIESLRLHPQFNTLKQLVQQNPAALPQVLTLIGNQNPELLAAIHANNDAFIAMMNEPITEAPPTAAATNPISAGGGGLGGMPDPAAMMQMLASMPPQQRAMFAQQLGMAPEQLEGVMQMMASMPPGQMENILNQAGMGGGMGGLGRGADPPGVIRLTQEEMESVNRLVALGFTQQQAAQAYLACDKNETLAANLLFDGGFGDDDGGFGGPEDDNMYN